MAMKIDDLIKLVEASKRVVDSPGLEAIISTQEDASLRSPGVSAHYYRLLYRLSQKMKADLMLELGTHTGISAACLAEGSPDGYVITMNNQDQLWANCKRPNVRYVLQDSLIPLELPGRIDILFIDTNHDGIHPLKEFQIYEDRVAQDGVVLFDDITLNKEMIKFWSEFHPDGWIKTELAAHGGAGFGALVRK